MSTSDAMSDIERLVELQAIYDLKGRRDHAVDQKDWDTYAKLHTDDYVAMSISAKPIVGGGRRPMRSRFNWRMSQPSIIATRRYRIPGPQQRDRRLGDGGQSFLDAQRRKTVAARIRLLPRDLC